MMDVAEAEADAPSSHFEQDVGTAHRAARCGAVQSYLPSLRGALATKQSILSLCREMDRFASLAMTT
jgi:hypothetical protein